MSKMSILKFLSINRLLSTEINLIITLPKQHSNVRYYSEGSDHKCDEVRGKHRLVPCKESDTVSLCIEEPLQLGPSAKMPSTCDENNFRVIIVGAGISGLSAGARLATTGLQDFLILEAKDRPGGRVETRKLGGTLIELGAEFIEGASIVNPIYQLACINGLISDKTPKVEHQAGIFLLSDCRSVEASKKVLEDFKKVIDDLPVQAEITSEAGQNVFHHIEKKMKKKISGYKEWEHDDAMRMVYSLMNELRAEFGIDLSNISVKNLGSRIISPGNRLRVDDGAIGIVKSLLNQIPKEKVLCNKGVQTIWWCEGTSGARVRCLDGTEYRACHVIVTASLGVLRTHCCLFCPPLPSEKIKAIQDIPFGRAAKLFLKYNDPFWLDPKLTLRFGWMKEELADRQDWIKGIGVIEELPSSSDHILRVTIGGREAECIECCGETALDLFRWLNSTVGTPLPLPAEAAVSTWNNDLYIGGNASFNAPSAQRILAQPLPTYEFPTLLFAGEATEPGYIGSMHAAARAGVREADNILKIIKKYSEESARMSKEYEKQLDDYDNELAAIYAGECPPRN